ncbi:telomerase-binding protein EST1A-like isoform X2 [Daphnia carinata]|uniref:telomerase-binding protein EST1A-like isoform X2 n=1 Tax=Daphnia carinata TaxID=120202 RepID=UPI00257D8C0E|nr:telomerase-binding protein EST1A-like isoform X2 [Daphnia carinata]
MNADIDHSRSSRRPRPEVAVYRPGSGPLKKSSSNVENIQPGSSSQGTGRTDIEGSLASNLRNVNLNDERNKSRDRAGEVYAQEPKSRKTNSQRHDKNASKPSVDVHHQQDANKKKEDSRELPVAQGKRQLYYQDNVETGSNQDLRQLLLEKRQQRNNESPSAGHSKQSPTPSQPANGKQKNNNQSEQQLGKPREEVKMSHPNAPSASNKTSQTALTDSASMLTRQSEKRSSGRRRNDRKPRVENSYSEGHLAALTNNNSPEATSNRPSTNFEEKKSISGSWNNLSRNNSKDTREEMGRGGGRKKRHNRSRGSSRRGSISSEAGTPLPDRQLGHPIKDDYHYYQSIEPSRIVRLVDDDKPTKKVGGSGGYYQAGSSKTRHSSSPQRSNSRNGMIPEENSGIKSPTGLFRRSPSVTSPTPSLPNYRQSSEPPLHPRYQNQVQNNFMREQRRERHFDERSQDSYRSDGRPPSGRAGSSRNDRPSLPNKFDSLPPRLKKKYEEERLLQLQSERIPSAQSISSVKPSPTSGHLPAKTEWEGSSRTFVNITGGTLPIRPSLPHPFPQSAPHSANIRPPHRPGSGAGNPLRDRHQPSSSGVASRFVKALPLSDQAEDSDPIHVPARPRSQDSMSFSDHGRERKTSVTDSRSSTPLSNVDSGSGMQLHGRATLRRLEEVMSATQTSLDWSEEMEEEDRRSLAGEHYNQPVASAIANKAPEATFACTDIRYRNKPMEGYTVIASSSANGIEADKQTSPPVAGRPLLGQGHRQDVRSNPPPRMSVPGLIQLPLGPPPSDVMRPSSSPRRSDVVSYPAGSSYDRSAARQQDHSRSYPRKAGPMQQRTLFDPSNPHKPIVVASRDGGSNGQQQSVASQLGCPEMTFLTLPADQGNNMSSRPAWYDPQSENFRSSKSHPHLLMDIARCDMELAWLLHGQGIHQRFNRIQLNRKFFQNSLRIMLANDLRFCQTENVEQHVWKIAFHNVIEALRKATAEEPEAKEEYRSLLFNVIDEGTAYFEMLLETLQEAHKFNLETFLEPQPYPLLSGLGYVGLAIISCQKILIFLGDLARYREMTSETSNYGKAKSWYTKANLINPKNGRPYNQLAILALYARRKLDAVYLYMRSLMASNPFQSARESLVSLFDENRKKYEQQERKRREAKEASSTRRKESASAATDAAKVDRLELRREIWIHPLDGRRTRRTTSTNGGADATGLNSDDEELAQLPSIEVNKRFVTSYLNVQGKLYTKIGMETFQECGVQMLREFRALLQQTPLPVNQTRLLQLLALNMFAVSNTQLKDARMAGGCRSAWQECALVVSLEMFNLLLERCNAMLKEQLETAGTTSLANSRLLGEDLQIILPAIKVWCDWLLCHSTVWNPPPTSRDYHVGPAGTPWTRLATLINLLNRFDTRQVEISNQLLEGYEAVKLPEDVTLCGFTPLMLNIQESRYTLKTSDTDMAADCVRIERMLYFGRDFLCGLDPPVLKLKFIGPSLSEYVSVVDSSSATAGPHQTKSDDVVQDDEEEEGLVAGELELEEEVTDAGPTDHLQQLRQRKDELTQKHLDRQRRKQQINAILRERVQVELEVRPKYLVADTNCYIDHLDALVRLTREKHYILVAPLVVLNELEGLCRSRLAVESRAALSFLREKNPQIRYVTSKGAPLPNFAACTMNEENDDQGLTNDDRILQCCLGLFKDRLASSTAEEDTCPDGVKRLRREVVLLTDDRNLRVKALSRDVPVRDLPAFLAWSSSAAATVAN